MVVMIPNEEMQHLMAERADVALGITKLIGLRRQRIERRLKNLLFLPNRERVVHLLIDLAEQFGLHTHDGIRLRVKLSHQDMANLIGSTRETVTVILGQLKSEGSVAGGRRKDAASMSRIHQDRGIDRQPIFDRTPKAGEDQCLELGNHLVVPARRPAALLELRAMVKGQDVEVRCPAEQRPAVQTRQRQARGIALSFAGGEKVLQLAGVGHRGRAAVA